MRRRIQRQCCFMLMMSVICLLFVSCKPTPAEIQVSKKMSEKDYLSEGQEMISLEQANVTGEWRWKDFRYKTSFYSVDGNVVINVDITGEYLDEPVPVLRLSHHDTTIDDVKAVAQAFMPDERYYDPRKLIEKEILQSWIKEEKRMMLPSNYYSDMPKEQVERCVRNAEENAAFYEELQKSTEYDPNKAVTDWTIRKAEDNYYDIRRDSTTEERNPSYEFRIRTEKKDTGYFGFIQMTNASTESFCSSELEYCNAVTYPYVGGCYAPAYSGDDAGQIVEHGSALQDAQKKISLMGRDMYLAAKSESNNIDTFWFLPTYFGIERIAAQQESEYSQEHMTERLYVRVSADGVYHMKLINAADVRIESQSFPLISKEEAISAFEKYMKTVYTASHILESEQMIAEEDLEDVHDIRIDVNELRFGYCRIPVEDRPQEYRLVPAWVFCGRIHYQHAGILYEGSYPSFPGVSDNEILMTINALDGSYIETMHEGLELR